MPWPVQREIELYAELIQALLWAYLGLGILLAIVGLALWRLEKKGKR